MRNAKKDTQMAMGRIDLYKPFLLISSHNGDIAQAYAVAAEISEYIDTLDGGVKRLAVHKVAQAAVSFAKNKDDIAVEACLNVISGFFGDPAMQDRCLYTDKIYNTADITADWAVQSFRYVGQELNKLRPEGT